MGKRKTERGERLGGMCGLNGMEGHDGKVKDYLKGIEKYLYATIIAVTRSCLLPGPKISKLLLFAYPSNLSAYVISWMWIG